jgi:hypothetical protein
LDFSEGHEKLIEGATVATVGFLTWITASTSKNATPGRTGYGWSWRLKDAIAHTFGNTAASTIFPGYSYPNAFTPAVMGWLNPYFIGGIALGIFDVLAREMKSYRDLPAVSSVVRGSAFGLAAGGAIGGIFDPNPQAAGPIGGGVGGAVPGMAPSISAVPAAVAAISAAHNSAIY